MAQRGISEPPGFVKTERYSLLKEACKRRPLASMKRNQANYVKYLDGMQESLNRNVQENIFPYWRNHNSLKGNVFRISKITIVFRLVCNELPRYCNESIAQKALTNITTETGRGIETK